MYICIKRQSYIARHLNFTIYIRTVEIKRIDVYFVTNSTRRVLNHFRHVGRPMKALKNF